MRKDDPMDPGMRRALIAWSVVILVSLTSTVGLIRMDASGELGHSFVGTTPDDPAPPQEPPSTF